MTAFFATPAPPGSRQGNRITALRWAKRLRELGWRARIAQEWRDETCDLLVALHARHSHASVARHARAHPGAPRVVVLTGTDLYGDIHSDAAAQESLELATRLVLLQPLGIRQLPERLRGKARVIRQSATAPPACAAAGAFTACALGHLRPVKDPFLAAEALLLVPETEPMRILHVGAALDDEMRAGARDAERRTGGRWAWLGERTRLDALRTLAGAPLLVLTSVHEGGANVVTEAIACGVPVLSTRIEGSLGILGDDYPGYFAVGDAAGLAALLRRCRSDAAFLAALRSRCHELRPLVDPAREREAWRDLLAELVTTA